MKSKGNQFQKQFVTTRLVFFAALFFLCLSRCETHVSPVAKYVVHVRKIYVGE